MLIYLINNIVYFDAVFDQLLKIQQSNTIKNIII